MKTQEELNALKEDVETVKEKLSALTDEELEQVTGGSGYLPYHPVAFEALPRRMRSVTFQEPLKKSL